MKQNKIKKQLGSDRKVQIEQGTYDGRFSPKKYDDKKKKIKILLDKKTELNKFDL